MRNFSQKLLGGATVFAILSSISTVVIHARTYTTTTTDTGTVGIFVTLFYVCCLLCLGLLYAAIPIACAVVVFRDAKKNKVEHRYFWTIFTLLFNVIGLIIYFLAIRPEYIRKNP